MYPPEIPKIHEVRRLELTYKLMYVLRDLGIKSAIQPSIDLWTDYMHIHGQLMISEINDDFHEEYAQHTE